MGLRRYKLTLDNFVSHTCGCVRGNVRNSKRQISLNQKSKNSIRKFWKGYINEYWQFECLVKFQFVKKSLTLLHHQSKSVRCSWNFSLKIDIQERWLKFAPTRPLFDFYGFFLVGGGCLKSRVYRNNLGSLAQLKENILQEMVAMRETRSSVSFNRASRPSHLEDVIFIK